MKPTTLLLTALAPLALASRPADSLAYSPRAGATPQRTFTMESELSLEDMTMELDGNDVTQMAGGIDVAMKVTSTVEVSDSYESVADGRPAKLRRTFDGISSSTHVSTTNPMTGTTDNTIDLVSDLEGATVVFTRDDEGDYGAAFEGEAGDAALLDGLNADLDLASVLPGREVSEEDSWELPQSFLRQILLPTGDLSLHAEDGSASEYDIGVEDIIDGIEGTVTATYGGTRTEDDVRVAVIRLELDAHSARDMSEDSEQMLEQMRENLPPGMEADLDAFDVELDYGLEGELYWNLEAGMPHSLQLSGTVSQVLDINMTMGNADERHAIVQSMTMGGSIKISMTVAD